MKKLLIFALLFLIFMSCVLIAHLHLARGSWIEHGEAAVLWDWKAALIKPALFVAVVQYACIFAAFLLAYVIKKCFYPWVALIFCVWGITWIPVAYACTGDLLRSNGGPFNFPIAMIVVPLFGGILLAEAAVILIIRARYKRKQGSSCEANMNT